MTFGDLKGRVKKHLNRNDLDNVIPDFIRMAQTRIEQEHNWKCMEKIRAYKTSNDYLEVPDDYKETIWLKVKDNNKYYDLLKTSLNHAFNIYPAFDYVGRPRVFATKKAADRFQLRPIPDKEYDYELYYYAYTPELVGDTDENWWTKNAWEILLYGALLEAEPFLIADERILVWANFYKEKIERLMSIDLSEKFTGPQAIRNGAIVV